MMKEGDKDITKMAFDSKTLIEIASKATPKQFLFNLKSLMRFVEEKDGG